MSVESIGTILRFDFRIENRQADFIFESTIYRKWYEKAGLEAFEMENEIFEGRNLSR